MRTRDDEVTATGGCLCGAVKYVIRGPLRDVIACHCTQCRRITGHHYAATATKRRYFSLIEQAGLRWYASSAFARRGFCATCGSVLFWDAAAYAHISIAAGTLDCPTGLKLVQHIFVTEKGDYYELSDGLPQVAGGAHGVAVPD